MAQDTGQELPGVQRNPVTGDLRTDPGRWRLRVHEGRNTWHYLTTDAELEAWPQTLVERHHLNTVQPADVLASPTPTDARDAVRKTFRYFAKTQTDDGHWACDYGGPLFLLPGLVFSCYITGGMPYLLEAQRIEIRRYLLGQIKSEGGWGIHCEGPSTMFGTALNYCVLRILGVPADEPRMAKARAFIRQNGGAVGTPSWGKFWLAALGVYSWDGLNPVPPELWLLPDAVPFHPGRYWCHTRQVYLPMSYVYGRRLVGPETDLIRSLREELYTERYATIDWAAARNTVCQIDLYAPHTTLLDALYVVLGLYEPFHSRWLREKALALVEAHVRAEDANTKCIGIGPVSKVINTLVAWDIDGNSSSWYLNHMDRIADYLWMADDGMKMNGTNGVQLWDTAFAVKAFLESGLGTDPAFRPTLRKALEFLDDVQVKHDVPQHDRFYRHMSKGGFPFSTRDCGWIVADCTAEGLLAVMYLQELPFVAHVPRPALRKMATIVPDERLFDAVHILLSMQNDDGGYGSYERTRGSTLLEMINPAEVFYDIMIEYSYTECTSAVVQALFQFRERFPTHRANEIGEAVDRGIQYIRRQQRVDGSWYGKWGVCFTNATWFALDALAMVGHTYATSPEVRKACAFLVSKQQDDGGWGETFRSHSHMHGQSCETATYSQHPTSQVTMTAWALLGLLSADYPDRSVVDRGLQLLLQRQLPNGNFAQESITGVFNRNCMIVYPNYQNYFPMWAFARYSAKYDGR